jgi:hypothetical protein
MLQSRSIRNFAIMDRIRLPAALPRDSWSLSIRNFAIMDRLDLEFDAGFQGGTENGCCSLLDPT